MAHLTTDAAEALLDKTIPVLDHGFVRLVDYMGSDARIVQAARVSYGAGTKSVRQDKGLIDYLLRNDHSSPFEQVVLTFHLKLPIFVARQLVRHRTARLNEISGRYSEMADDFYVPAAADIRPQLLTNRQGRAEEAFPAEAAEAMRTRLAEEQKSVYATYRELLDKGVSREVARINLPLAVYTEMYWQMDLRNLLHFLALRLDGHAQLEIRVYAEAIATIVRAVTPYTWESFERHVLRARQFNGDQLDALRAALAARAPELLALLDPPAGP